MIIPIGKSVGKQGGGHILILINRKAPDSSEEENKGASYENFNVHLTPCFKSTFKELLTHVILHNELNIAKTQDIADENLTLRTIDTIMATASTYEFIKQIEKNMAKLFNCERANVIMVHRQKKFLYRIERDPATMEDKMEQFELQKGLAGFVTVAGHTILSESIRTDGRFIKEIDDPLGPAESPALQIISAPIISHTDNELMSRGDQDSAYPRAIVQLINRRSSFANFATDLSTDVKELLKQSVKFDQSDIEKMERLAWILGRCHEVVNKIEQLHSMRDQSQAMMDLSNQLSNHIEMSKSNFQGVQSQFKKFMEETTNKGNQVKELNAILESATEKPPAPKQ